jgi:hypothetical protein
MTSRERRAAKKLSDAQFHVRDAEESNLTITDYSDVCDILTACEMSVRGLLTMEPLEAVRLWKGLRKEQSADNREYHALLETGDNAAVCPECLAGMHDQCIGQGCYCGQHPLNTIAALKSYAP